MRAFSTAPIRPSLLLAAACALAPACGRERPGVPPEHVLLVTLADVRADRTSAWLHRLPTTRVRRMDGGEALDLDRLADEGVRFAAAFAPSPRTEFSLASLLTGCSARTWAGVLPRDIGDRATLAELFSASGFETVAFVSSPSPLARTDLLRGFDRVVEERDAAPLLERAVRWIRAEFDPERPTLIWLHLGDTREPWDPRPLPGEEAGRDPRSLFLPSGTDGDLPDAGLLAAARQGSVEVDAEAARTLRALYDADLARTSRALRLFMEFYAHTHGAARVLDRTLVVVAGTNGVELGERGWREGEVLLDATLRVPLLFRHPPSLTGRRILAEVVELSDVLPTICEWMDLEPPVGADGRTLLPLVDSYVRRPFPRRPALAVGEEGGRSLRDRRWRLWLPPGEDEAAAELFDHRIDPLERHDRAASHPALVREWALEARGGR